MQHRWSGWKRRGVIGVVLTLVAVGVPAGLLWAGVLHANNPSRDRYPVWGVDVSRYQGTIDWPVLAGQGIEFAFIKATEGSSTIDPQFATNLAGATAAGLRVGAYHFFSFDSPGATQAENIVRTVPATTGMLPVAVDVEFYGDFWTHPAPVEVVRRELADLLDRLTAQYGTPPMVYTTSEVYSRYITGEFPGIDIWIRDIWREPSLADARVWTFWQFSERHRLAGYTGEESYIDLNAFAGDRNQWEHYRR